jgi:phosphatidylinositol alpha-mannosyltransferase
MEGAVKKIGIVSEFFYPHLGGITEHVFFTAKEFAKRGHEVVILTGYLGEPPGVELPAGVRVQHLARSMKVYANGSIGKISYGMHLGKKIKALLRQENFDLLHLHNPLDPVLPLLFLKYTDTVTVGTFHSLLKSAHYFKIFHRIAQNHLDKLAGVIAVSPSCAEFMAKHFHNDFHVFPNGVDIDWYSKPTGKIKKFDDGAPNIFFLGRLDPRNGLDLLLEAFPEVERKVPDARLIIAGDGPLRPDYEKKSGKRLGEKIFFEGAINPTRPNYFATSQVFCYPATIASFGITLVEAMAAGVPVVATDNEGFRGVVEQGRTGLLFPQGDAAALAQEIIRVLRDPELARRLARNARVSVEKYSWSHIADRLLNYYDSIFLQHKGMAFAS